MAHTWYTEQDRTSPHYSHIIQPYGEGQSYCLDCDGPHCVSCHAEPVKEDGGMCGECISRDAEYWAEYRREGRQPL